MNTDSFPFQGFAWLLCASLAVSPPLAWALVLSEAKGRSEGLRPTRASERGSPAPATSAEEWSGIPPLEDLHRILREEKVPLLYTWCGDWAFGLLFGLASEDPKAYWQRIKAGVKLSEEEQSYWRRRQTAAGKLMSSYDVDMISVELQLSRADFLRQLRVSPDSENVVVVDVTRENRHRTLLEETLHVLEGFHPQDQRTQRFREAVNDLLQLMFFPRGLIDRFQSSYTKWNDQQKAALQKRYLEKTGFDPNAHLRSIVEALLEDFENDATIEVADKEVLISELIYSDYLSQIENSLFEYQRTGVEYGTIDYLRSLLTTERFSKYSPLFPHWNPAASAEEGTVTGVGSRVKALHILLQAL